MSKEEREDLVAIIGLRKDGSASILSGDDLQDWLAAENNLLARCWSRMDTALLVENYSLCLDYTEEAMWGFGDFDKIEVLDSLDCEAIRRFYKTMHEKNPADQETLNE